MQLNCQPQRNVEEEINLLEAEEPKLWRKILGFEKTSVIQSSPLTMRNTKSNCTFCD